jgi:C-terminal processing protease CtpA/Prc
MGLFSWKTTNSKNYHKFEEMKEKLYGIGISIYVSGKTFRTYVSNIHCNEIKQIVSIGDIINDIDDINVSKNTIHEIREKIVGRFNSSVKIKFINKEGLLYEHTFIRNKETKK